MAYDGITTRTVVYELNKMLKAAKVNKVLQPNKNEIILEVYSKDNGRENILINVSPDACRIHLTSHLKPNPETPFNFCMLLRKYLVGSKILEVSNYDLERTVEFKFESINEMGDIEKRRLYIEVMSRQSNIILTNANGVIIDVLRHFDSDKRLLLPANHYEFTPILKSSFLEIETFDEFMELISENDDEKLSIKLPDIFIGFSRLFIRQALTELGLPDTNYTDEDLESLYNYLKKFIQNIETNRVKPVIVDKDYTLVSCSPIADKYAINHFLNEYYFIKEQKTLFQSSKSNLLKIVSSSLKKVYKKLENINQKLIECNEMDKYKLYGELLTSNLYRLDGNSNLPKVEVLNYYTNENITIPLDIKYNVSNNVQRFFKKYNKLKNTLSICGEQKLEAEKEIDYLESIIFSIDNAKTMDNIKEVYQEVSQNIATKREIKNPGKSNKKEIVIDYVEIEGYKIYVGKNNIQNDYLTFTIASREDIWLHAQRIQGSHVVIKTNGQDEVSDNVIFEAAKLAKENSKGKNSGVLPVDYCRVKFVKRALNGKLGMVNYTNFNTILVK